MQAGPSRASSGKQIEAGTHFVRSGLRDLSNHLFSQYFQRADFFDHTAIWFNSIDTLRGHLAVCWNDASEGRPRVTFLDTSGSRDPRLLRPHSDIRPNRRHHLPRSNPRPFETGCIEPMVRLEMDILIETTRTSTTLLESHRLIRRLC